MKSKHLEIYADGAGIMVGSTVSKLNFYSVVDISEDNNEKQIEELKVQIAIPTVTLLKVCARFLQQVKTDELEIISVIDSHKEEIIKTLASLTLQESDGE
ncbi:MAG: hypothetical protein ACKO9I_01765 [Sphaerospermopsis kisseleviana]|uniref:Uncharacterized protein n=1 Tax=Sphaerospermopsis reniformis TaxID=531300 RepID=A0A479ZY23_9CYAN|nr:hypothetical protein [Sphaerospermopsis reniformis]MEB3147409.1 hypothetical protein [Sphaerospermopsis sp.]GCL36001.1 hypothetical protein SR1949_11010 [Sphaerospermopsis reniformis]